VEGNQLVPVTKEPCVPVGSRELVLSGSSAFFIEGAAKYLGRPESDSIRPARVWRIDLTSGAARPVATATSGGFSDLGVHDGRLWWWEGKDRLNTLIPGGPAIVHSCALSA
jgi:hypothetical protein